jgi:peptidoglycan/LPS O-acetylase OafA/YrhL
MSTWALGHRPALDGVRAVAVLLVMAAHFGVPGFTSAGDVGVEMFFVLSGFLITALLMQEQRVSGRISLSAFYVRRALRLLPALGVLLTIFLAFEVLRGDLAFALPRALAAMFCIGNWANAAINLGPLAHTWSLGVEEQFYAVWPLLLGVALLSGRRWLPAAAALSALALCIVLSLGGASIGQLERSVDALMLGALIAMLAMAGHLPRRWPFGWAGLASVLLIAVIPLDSAARVGWTFGLLAVALTTAVAIIACVTQEDSLTRLLSARPAVWVGRISYSLYLWHYLVMWIGMPTTAGFPWPVRVALLSAVSFLCAAASWRYVEAPLLRWRSARKLGRLAEGVAGQLRQPSVRGMADA